MKTLFKQIGALGLLLASLALSSVAMAAEPKTTIQPPAKIQLAWDRVGSPVQPFA